MLIDSVAISMASVCLTLAKEDAEELQSGNAIALHDVCSASMLISTGLELEEEQYELFFKHLNPV